MNFSSVFAIHKIVKAVSIFIISDSSSSQTSLFFLDNILVTRKYQDKMPFFMHYIYKGDRKINFYKFSL